MRSLIHSWTYAVRRQVAGTLLLMTLFGTGCQAWHTEGIAPEALLVNRQPTMLRVTLTDGSQVVLEHPVLRGDTLLGTGVGHNGEHDLRIPLTDVRQLATRGFSAGRTVGLGVGVAALFFGAVVIASVTCGNACSH
jgi:hypothetical protein